jgi:hypothetical protein
MDGDSGVDRKRREGAAWREKNREKLRLDAIAYRARQPKSGRKRGAQPKHADRSPEAAARRRCEAVARWRASPRRVSQSWYREQFRVGLGWVLHVEGVAAHQEWFDSLDDEPAPGIELTDLLWSRPLVDHAPRVVGGRSGRAMDGAPQKVQGRTERPPRRVCLRLPRTEPTPPRLAP